MGQRYHFTLEVDTVYVCLGCSRVFGGLQRFACSGTGEPQFQHIPENCLVVATYETDVAARKPRAEYTRGLTIVGEAWDYMGNLTEVVYSISSVY